MRVSIFTLAGQRPYLTLLLPQCLDSLAPPKIRSLRVVFVYFI